MADRRTVITLSVQDDFSRQLQTFARQMADAEKGVQNLGKSAQSGGGLTKLNEALFFASQNGMLVYNTFSRIFTTLDQWSQMGFNIQKTNMALSALVGTQAQQYIDAVQQALNGTVTSAEAAAQAYTLVKFHLADTAESAGEFARTMAIVAQANPQLGGVNNALTQISLTLANTSFMRLDQLGLSAIDVKNRMTELQNETKGLSREAAFQQAVLEGLNEEANTLGDSFLTVGGNTGKFKAQLRELKDQLYVTTADGVEGLSTALLSLEQIILNLDKIDWSFMFPSDTDMAKIGALLRLTTGVGGYGEELWNWATGTGPTTPDYGVPYTGPYANDPNARFNNMLKNGISPSITNYGAPRDIFAGSGSGIGPMDYLPPGFTRASGSTLTDQARSRYHQQMVDQQYGFVPNVAVAMERGVMGGPGQLGTAYQFEKYFSQGIKYYADAQATIDQMTKELGGNVFNKAAAGAERIAAALGQGVSHLGDMASDAQAVSERFNEMKNMSLDQVLGIDPSRLASDVFKEMSDALKQAGVDETAAAEAMKNYELQTGLATGASEYFAGRMDDLAQKLADGKISVNDYVDAVMKLSTTDMSWLNDLTQFYVDTQGASAATNFLNSISGLSPEEVTARRDQAAQAVSGWGSIIRGVVSGPGEGHAGEMANADPMQQMMTNTQTMIDLLKQENPLNVTTTEATAAVTEFQSFVEGVVGARYRLGVEIYATNSTLSVPINVSSTGTGGSNTGGSAGVSGGNSTIEEFAEGGYTGSGSDPFLAMLHPDEVVIPMDKIRNSTGARGGDRGVRLENYLYIDGRAVAIATQREKRLRNER